MSTAPIEPTVCRECGGPLAPADVFCDDCGSRVPSATMAYPPVPSSASVPPPGTGIVWGGSIPSGSAPQPPPLVPPPPPGPAPGSSSPRVTRRAAQGPSAVPVTPGTVAPVGTRVVAYALDLLVALVVAGLGWVVARELGLGPVLLPAALVLALLVGQWVAEARTGATIGGAITRIRTVSTSTGRPAGLRVVLVRQLVVAVGSLVCFVGQWVVVASGTWDHSPAQRGWHDKAAGTVVLRARAVRRPATGSPRTASGWNTADARAAGVAVEVGDAEPSLIDVPVVVAAPVAPPALVVEPAPDVAAPAERPTVDGAERPLITGMPGVGPQVPAAPVAPAAPLIEVPSFVVAPPPEDPDPAQWVAPVPVSMPEPEPEAGAEHDPGLGELELTRLRPDAPAAPLPTPLHLRFDTGEAVEVTGDGLVGRRPAPEDGIVHVVAIDDPDRSISRVHLAFGLEPGGRRLWVADRASTNGTVLVAPDGTGTVLPPGARATVEPGWTIRFGRRSVQLSSS
ncbi:RDD family protein [Cellulomonas sp. P5_C6]